MWTPALCLPPSITLRSGEGSSGGTAAYGEDSQRNCEARWLLNTEDFVDDGNDVGDVEGSVVVHVALLGGEGDDHLGVGRDGAGEGVVLDVGSDVESVEDDLVESAAWLWCEGKGGCVAVIDLYRTDAISEASVVVDRDTAFAVTGNEHRYGWWVHLNDV